MIEPIVNYEIVELTRHFGSIVGTPGISEEVLKECNKYLLKLVKCMEANVNKVTATNSGLIT